MQPHSGANRGRKRGFAGDFPADSGLVGRIARLGGPRGPRRQVRPAADKHLTLHQTRRKVPEYRRTH